MHPAWKAMGKRAVPDAFADWISATVGAMAAARSEKGVPMCGKADSMAAAWWIRPARASGRRRMWLLNFWKRTALRARVATSVTRFRMCGPP